jgi:gliding motility-associated-like protein
MRILTSTLTVLQSCIIMCLLCSNTTWAQLPICSSTGGIIYYNSGTSIGMYNPSLPPGPGNPSVNTIALPPGTVGMAISDNINGPGASPTFYAITGSSYWYYNGTTWINTGHSAGNAAAVNIGAGGGFIYNLVGGSGEVYKYDGTGNGVLLVTIPSFGGGGPYDLAADCEGNFYILKIAFTPTNPAYLQKYDKFGTLLQTWGVIGPPSTAAGGGMGIIGNTVYFHNVTGFWEGTMGTTSITFTNVPGVAITPSDFATCPIGTIGKAKASIDTGYYCGPGNPPVTVSVSGAPPFVWTVLSGPAVVTGSGQVVDLTGPGGSISKIEVRADGVTECGGPGKDTVTLIVPEATVNAGKDDTTFGCAVYLDTLAGSVTNKTPGITYNINWTPLGSIFSGATSLKPVVAPIGSPTVYTITVSTPANQGGCIWTDDMVMTSVDASVGTADFTFESHLGCIGDTIIITNTSGIAFGKATYNWFWNDFSKNDTSANPIHVYYDNKDSNRMVLIINNGLCKDTVGYTAFLKHEVRADIGLSDDRLCPGDTITFSSDKSSATKIPITYFWDFGDGATSTQPSPIHSFNKPGDQLVTLVATDSLDCKDTVDVRIPELVAVPKVDVGPDDTTICDGDIIFLPLGISVRGTDYLWQDGSKEPRHAVTKAGIYVVRISNVCGTDIDSIHVKTRNCKLWFTGAFTPNGDGKNDLAKLLGVSDNITDLEIAIYNRYSERVYFSRSATGGWDGTFGGKPQPIGTYYYYVKYTYGNSSPEVMKGDITLMR